MARARVLYNHALFGQAKLPTSTPDTDYALEESYNKNMISCSKNLIPYSKNSNVGNENLRGVKSPSKNVTV
jgi:hypothetical protein